MLEVKKCLKCNALVQVLNDCTCEGCGFTCCNEKMITLTCNTTDASFEKHIPEVEVQGDKLLIKVNHVMEENHYIEWISIVDGNTQITKYFKPNEDPIIEYSNKNNIKIYAYCNLHNLWMKEF